MLNRVYKGITKEVEINGITMILNARTKRDVNFLEKRLVKYMTPVIEPTTAAAEPAVTEPTAAAAEPETNVSINTKTAVKATKELTARLETELGAEIIARGSIVRVRLSGIKVCELWSKKGSDSELHMEGGSDFEQLFESYFPGRGWYDLGHYTLNHVARISYKEFGEVFTICECLAESYKEAAEEKKAARKAAEEKKAAKK